MTVFTEDQGTAFGTWPDATSRLLYQDCMPAMLNGFEPNGRVYDYGGANGLLKAWIPDSVSVDIDATKEPDILADVTTFNPEPNSTVVMRYLLHYLDDAAIGRMMHHLFECRVATVLVIQFVNDNLPAKQRNSIGETKYFRRESQLLGLLQPPWSMRDRKRLDYTVAPEFYSNRLAPSPHTRFFAHDEAIVAYELH